MAYICTGLIHPERADVSFGRVELGLADGKAVASCDASQVTVILDQQLVDGWISAHILAADIAGIVVGALGFSLGSGYSVEIVQVTETDGTPHVFGVRPGDAGHTLGFDPHLPAFNRAIRLSSRDIFFRLAIRDYLRALTVVADCATYCYRAIEGIKSAYVFRTGADRWDDMHASLGTDREEITLRVKQYADAVRHGNWIEAKPTDRKQRWAMLTLTRSILTRYLDKEEPNN